MKVEAAWYVELNQSFSRARLSNWSRYTGRRRTQWRRMTANYRQPKVFIDELKRLWGVFSIIENVVVEWGAVWSAGSSALIVTTRRAWSCRDCTVFPHRVQDDPLLVWCPISSILNPTQFYPLQTRDQHQFISAYSPYLIWCSYSLPINDIHEILFLLTPSFPRADPMSLFNSLSDTSNPFTTTITRSLRRVPLPESQ